MLKFKAEVVELSRPEYLDGKAQCAIKQEPNFIRRKVSSKSKWSIKQYMGYDRYPNNVAP